MPAQLGIDLGTTNSLCAVFRDGAAQLVPNGYGRYLTPSVVGVLDSGEVVVGEAARELLVLHPNRACARFKRWMGTDRVVDLGAHRFTPPELSSLVLRSLKADAEAFLGVAVEAAVITVPAYFNEVQRQATRVAGELAGLRVLRLLNEPTAAALAYGMAEPAATRRTLVFDLGGGTFDVTLMDCFEGTLEIMASAGDGYLGGEDFTDALVRWALRREPEPFERLEATQTQRVGRLRLLAEQAKRELGVGGATRIALPDRDGTLSADAPVEIITREDFDAATAALRKRLVRPIEQVLRDGNLEVAGVDEVVLAGGATRDPAVQALVEALFGKRPRCSEAPDLVVAKGAAIQVALLADDRAVSDLVMTDVCPFTLGLEISKHLLTTLRDGYFLPIIPRNTTIPTAREQQVATLHPGQTALDLKVYQGESRRVAENVLLGTLRVTGIPPGPAGQVVAVRFAYDPSGLLEVEAVVQATGARFQATLTHHAKTLDAAQIAAARARLAKVKFFPRDEQRNLRVLLFAERVLGQLSFVDRPHVEELIDAYERALWSTDRGLFEGLREALLDTLAQLGFSLDEDAA
jgi:molecular chaperone HscC